MSKSKMPSGVLSWDMPVVLAFFIWFCILPVVGWLIVPFFGWGISLMVAAGLLVIILTLCWLLCFGAFRQTKNLNDK